MKKKKITIKGDKNKTLFLNSLLAIGNEAKIKIQNIKKKALNRVDVIGSNIKILKVTTPQLANCI